MIQGRRPLLKPVLGVVAALWGAYFLTQQRTEREIRLDRARVSQSQSLGTEATSLQAKEWVPPVIPRYPVPDINPMPEERDNAEYRMRRARSSALIW